MIYLATETTLALESITTSFVVAVVDAAVTTAFFNFVVILVTLVARSCGTTDLI